MNKNNLLANLRLRIPIAPPLKVHSKRRKHLNESRQKVKSDLRRADDV